MVCPPPAPGMNPAVHLRHRRVLGHHGGVCRQGARGRDQPHRGRYHGDRIELFERVDHHEVAVHDRNSIAARQWARPGPGFRFVGPSGVVRALLRDAREEPAWPTSSMPPVGRAGGWSWGAEPVVDVRVVSPTGLRGQVGAFSRTSTSAWAHQVRVVAAADSRQPVATRSGLRCTRRAASGRGWAARASRHPDRRSGRVDHQPASRRRTAVRPGYRPNSGPRHHPG